MWISEIPNFPYIRSRSIVGLRALCEEEGGSETYEVHFPPNAIYLCLKLHTFA